MKHVLLFAVALVIGASIDFHSAHTQTVAPATPAPTEKMDADASRVDGGIQPKTADHPRNVLIVEMRNLDRYIVHVKLHSKQRHWQWPAGNEVFTLKDSQFHTMRLTCRPGEKICYGAARSGNYAKYWGVGIQGRNGCRSCCMECGGSYRYTLNASH
jgi:hypothetical protein